MLKLMRKKIFTIFTLNFFVYLIQCTSTIISWAGLLNNSFLCVIAEQITFPDYAACLSVKTFLHMCGLNFTTELRVNAEAMSPSGESDFDIYSAVPL